MRAASGGGHPRSTSSSSACRSIPHSCATRSARAGSNPARHSRRRRQATTSSSGISGARKAVTRGWRPARPASYQRRARKNAAPAVEWGEQSDEGIVQAVLDGNTALFELLMRRYNERLYRTARAITRDDREAEDVMQQAYVNAYTSLRQFKGQTRFATWLTRITINEALARVRRRGRYEPFEDDPMDANSIVPIPSGPDPERQAFASELRDLLEWAIDALPAGAREVFMLRDVEGLNTADTAASLGVSEDVVKTRLSRARTTLRRFLLERAGASAPDVFRFQRPRCDRVVALVLARIADQSGPSTKDQGPGTI